MGAETVAVALEGDVAVVTIQRPERRNALDSATATAVKDAVDETSSEARVIVLTGSGGAFCAGGDLEELQRWSDSPHEEIEAGLYSSFQGMIRSIRASAAVVIAAVDGAAVGAGMDLALACDLRIASERAKFGQVWVGLGVIPGTGGAWLTPSIVGPTRAAELLLTGEIISAERALEFGIVNEVVPSGRLMETARAWADRILKHPKDGVIANKRAFVAATDGHLEAALAHAASVQPARFTSDEFKAAVKARLG